MYVTPISSIGRSHNSLSGQQNRYKVPIEQQEESAQELLERSPIDTFEYRGPRTQGVPSYDRFGQPYFMSAAQAIVGGEYSVKRFEGHLGKYGDTGGGNFTESFPSVTDLPFC